METWIKHIKDKKIIAIDPGKNGGLAVYSIDEDKVIDLVTMPETASDLYEFIKKYKMHARCYIERVGGIPGMGASAMFNFGKGFGHLEMALIVCNIPTTEVTPQKWQKELQLGNKGKQSTNEWKVKLKNRAQQIFPTVEKEFGLKTKKEWLSVSDALLILEYARKQEIRK